jgi:hypothetical protein
MRQQLGGYIETGDLALLRALGYIMLEKDWSLEDLEVDLGSNAIEILLEDLAASDYEKMQETLSHLNFE